MVDEYPAACRILLEFVTGGRRCRWQDWISGAAAQSLAGGQYVLGVSDGPLGDSLIASPHFGPGAVRSQICSRLSALLWEFRRRSPGVLGRRGARLGGNTLCLLLGSVIAQSFHRPSCDCDDASGDQPSRGMVSFDGKSFDFRSRMALLLGTGDWLCRGYRRGLAPLLYGLICCSPGEKKRCTGSICCRVRLVVYIKRRCLLDWRFRWCRSATSGLLVAHVMRHCLGSDLHPDYDRGVQRSHRGEALDIRRAHQSEGPGGLRWEWPALFGAAVYYCCRRRISVSTITFRLRCVSSRENHHSARQATLRLSVNKSATQPRQILRKLLCLRWKPPAFDAAGRIALAWLPTP